MRALVQRVTSASVSVDGRVVGSIGPGLLAMVGVTHNDGASQVEAMARKLHEVRVLRGEQSCASTDAPLLVVSQFTLYGDTRKGRRPSWADAAPGSVAQPLVEDVVAALRQRGAGGDRRLRRRHGGRARQRRSGHARPRHLTE